MVPKPTVLVIGAGSSTEVGLPTGSDLRYRIATLLDIRFDAGVQKSGDETIVEALRRRVQKQDKKNINPYLREARYISAAMPQALSIDDFIDINDDNDRLVLCGKLGIVRAILNAERASRIYINPRDPQSTIPFQKIEDTWLNKFFKVLTENCRKDELRQRLSGIALIVFNYDRCVEHYLFNAVRNYYQTDEQEAAIILQGLRIFHPYGVVGHLPWQREDDSVAFGADAGPSVLLGITSQLQTFSEGTDVHMSEIEEIRAAVLGSEILVFLGFAFHPLNMKLLTADAQQYKNLGARPKEIYATAIGISASDCELIGVDLGRLCQNGSVKKQHLNNSLTCAALFDEHWRSLAVGMRRAEQ